MVKTRRQDIFYCAEKIRTDYQNEETGTNELVSEHLTEFYKKLAGPEHMQNKHREHTKNLKLNTEYCK